jgi:phosphoribosylformylglycinamidine synthase
MTTVAKARVLVTLRPEILDAQGQTIKTSLAALGFSDVKNVRVGKVIEIEMAHPISSQTLQSIEKMSNELLANPIMEDFKVEAL